MKRFAVFTAVLLLSGTAVAQPKAESQAPARDTTQGPVKAEEFSPVQTVNVSIGQAKLIKINRMIGDIQMSVNNVVRASVMGDKGILSVTGVSPGATDLVIVNQYSEVIYIARVNVSAGLQSEEDNPPHIVRTYGWTDTSKKSGGNSLVTIVNGDSKGGNSNDPSPDFIERYCSSSGCSQPLSPASQGAGLDATDPRKRN